MSGFRLGRVMIPSLQGILGQRFRWLTLKANGLVKVGPYTYGVPNVLYWDYETKLEIGKYCSIAEGVTFILGGNHRVDWISTFHFQAFPKIWGNLDFPKDAISSNGNITIKNDVWIGHGAIILSGVHVGNGAVIGAGSVVTKDVEDFAIVAGNPAKLIRFRFDEETRKEILESEWWNDSKELVQSNINQLMNPPLGKNNS
jgi:acetyltransferase-like isoleucine patch superfamily enzyme